MATARQRLQKAHNRLEKLVPFATVEEAMIVDGKTVKATAGQSPKGGTFEATNAWGTWGGNLAPESHLLSLVEAVEERVEERIAAMDEFLQRALDAQLPEIALDALTDGNSDLREHFTKMMQGRARELSAPGEIDSPFSYVSHDGKFESLSTVSVGITHSVQSVSFKLDCYNFKDALNLFYVWDQVVAWVDGFLGMLKAAKDAQKQQAKELKRKSRKTVKVK